MQRYNTNKYHNILSEMDGFKFHSKKEMARYADLKLMQQAGEITDLTLQKRYRIEVNQQHICDYICDFSYIIVATNEHIVEDVKGMPVPTPIFALKSKLMKACLGIDVVVV